MRTVGILALTLLLVFGLLGLGLSVCRSFLDADCAAQMAGASQDTDHCQKMCQFGRDEFPAVLEKVPPEFSSGTPAILVQHLMLPLSPQLHLIHEASRLDFHNKLPIGEVYLLNASFLI